MWVLEVGSRCLEIMLDVLITFHLFLGLRLRVLLENDGFRECRGKVDGG